MDQIFIYKTKFKKKGGGGGGRLKQKFEVYIWYALKYSMLHYMEIQV